MKTSAACVRLNSLSVRNDIHNGPKYLKLGQNMKEKMFF